MYNTAGENKQLLPICCKKQNHFRCIYGSRSAVVMREYSLLRAQFLDLDKGSFGLETSVGSYLMHCTHLSQALEDIASGLFGEYLNWEKRPIEQNLRGQLHFPRGKYSSRTSGIRWGSHKLADNLQAVWVECGWKSELLIYPSALWSIYMGYTFWSSWTSFRQRIYGSTE